MRQRTVTDADVPQMELAGSALDERVHRRKSKREPLFPPSRIASREIFGMTDATIASVQVWDLIFGSSK